MSIFPKIQKPYFVGAPAWTHKSSGVRSLHLLCHALNEAGKRAWILPEGSNGWCTHPALSTPVITQEVLNFYKSEDIDPICVYPDVTRGNPLGYGKVARWLLAPAGAYGGSTMEEFREWADKVYTYRRDIPGGDTLCCPTFDPDIFHPPEKGAPRYGSCYYANKYDKIHGQRLQAVTEKSIRLQGDWKTIANVLQGSQVCYIYEMTEVIVLAQMCGCPVKFVKTPYFRGVDLADWQFTMKSGESAFDFTNRLAIEFNEQLENFIKDTQAW